MFIKILHLGNSVVLTANFEGRTDGDIRIHLDNLPSPGQHDDKVIIFFKRKPDVITPENMHKVRVKSNDILNLSFPPRTYLYHL